jgi:hypothetical protein
MQLHRYLFVLALLACRREEHAGPATKSQATASALANPQPTPRAAPAPAAASALARPSSDDAAEAAAADTVRAWSDALDRHEPAKLAELYGASVYFYGRKFTQAAVVLAKETALRKQTTFHQQIVGPLEFGRTSDENISVNFTKRSGEAGKLRDVEAVLVLAPGVGGTWVIVNEGDALPRAASDSASDACQAKAAEVANALPEVKRAVDEAMRTADKSGGSARFGGIGPEDDGNGGIVASMGIHTDESFETQVAYSVDRRGHLSVTVLGTELTIPSSELRSVERACRR